MVGLRPRIAMVRAHFPNPPSPALCYHIVLIRMEGCFWLAKEDKKKEVGFYLPKHFVFRSIYVHVDIFMLLLQITTTAAAVEYMGNSSGGDSISFPLFVYLRNYAIIIGQSRRRRRRRNKSIMLSAGGWQLEGRAGLGMKDNKS